MLLLPKLILPRFYLPLASNPCMLMHLLTSGILWESVLTKAMNKT